MDLDSLLKIGTDLDAVVASKEAILEILAARADQKTIRLALKAFTKSVQPTNTMVTNCHFIGENTEPKHKVHDTKEL